MLARYSTLRVSYRAPRRGVRTIPVVDGFIVSTLSQGAATPRQHFFSTHSIFSGTLLLMWTNGFGQPYTVMPLYMHEDFIVFIFDDDEALDEIDEIRPYIRDRLVSNVMEM